MTATRWPAAVSLLFLLVLSVSIYAAQRALNNLSIAAPVLLNLPLNCGVNTHALYPANALTTAVLPMVLGLLCAAFAGAARRGDAEARGQCVLPSNEVGPPPLWRGVAALPLLSIALQLAAGLGTLGLVSNRSVREVYFEFVTGIAWAPWVAWSAGVILLLVCVAGLYGAQHFRRAMHRLHGGMPAVTAARVAAPPAGSPRS